MERLTIHSKNSDMVWFKDAENSNARLEPCEMTAHHNRMALDKLATYEDAEEQGRLIKLPCKVGDIVYDTTWWDDVQEKIVVKGKTYYRTVHKHKVTKLPFTYSDIDNFGKTVFLTKSEAEAKLKELRHNHD